MDAHFGLTFVAPLTFSKLVITGSKDLKNVQEWEDTLTARDESWDLLTQGEAGDWVRPLPRLSLLITIPAFAPFPLPSYERTAGK